MRLCENCKHAKPPLFWWVAAKAKYHHAGCAMMADKDPTTGKDDLIPCSVARGRYSYREFCGPEAKFYEPKPPSRWHRFLNWINKR